MKPPLSIEGYTDQLSVSPGSTLTFHVSSDAPTYSVEISRVGSARQVVWSRNSLTGNKYPVPADASTHGCRWPPGFELTVPHDWPSGYYSAILRAEHDGVQTAGEIAFIIRSEHPGRAARILLQLTTNTDCAYNSWGGYTLYSGPTGPARRISFDRPFAGFAADGEYLFQISGQAQEALNQRIVSDQLRAEFNRQGAIDLSPHTFVKVDQPSRRWYVLVPGTTYTAKLDGEHINIYNGFSAWQSGWKNWEYPFVRWAEKAGYQIDYAANTDLEFNPEILEPYRLVLSVGHDEYWSSPMRDHLENYIAGGGNVAFFSGNCLFWQVRSEDNGRALTCWKDHQQDPFFDGGDHRLLTTNWCHHLIDRPENHLTGVSFAYGGYYGFFDKYQDGDGAYTIHRPDHWVFSGTGLQQGDRLGSHDQLVNYECDGCQFNWHDGLPVPTYGDGTPETFEILATAPAELSHADDSVRLVSEALHGQGTQQGQQQPGAAVMGLYEQGGTVLTTGCTEWAKGLRGGDPVVEQITRNILDRLSV
ncbi:MAG: hypothetical protein CMJ81_11115 [Planctomycetaceae bacterium]|nr:hypothetical protein [Planctomycetaceae bacterium]